jgi:hypothetical protein
LQQSYVPTLRRNTLLPHRFAGICMNCHVILASAPMPVNPDTADILGLGPADRELVRAGQEVRMPSIISDIKAPLIGREANLVHSYWGVCSNCHTIVHAGNGAPPKLVADGMRRARQRLLSMHLSDKQIAYANPEVGLTPQVFASYVFGAFALLCLIALVALPYLKNLPPGRAAQLHIWSGIGLTFFAVLHWLFSPRGNAVLHLGLIFVLGLTVSGVFTRARAARGLLGTVHVHRYALYLVIATIAAGHLAVSSLWL